MPLNLEGFAAALGGVLFDTNTVPIIVFPLLALQKSQQHFITILPVILQVRLVVP